ncbi:unnamed protein product [Dicrocoelium dendriticum]|nr:unnamed protein product [Dicrocoelium dendriticum]CAH8563793.1 unnamed protein product [Dicrocoelium dendriticum]
MLKYIAHRFSTDPVIVEVNYNGLRCLVFKELSTPSLLDAAYEHKPAEIIIVCGGQITELPQEMKLMKNVQLLSITSSAFQNASFICELTNLSLLNLSGNRLLSIPNEISNLRCLKVLDLSTNNISIMPEGIFKLKMLQSLDISENGISELPASISKLRGLQVLACASNKLHVIPEEISHLSNLQILNLINNKLSFLPISIGNLKSLLVIHVDHNELDHIPSQLFHCSSLTELSVSNNFIFGYLSSEIGSLTNLRALNLSSNQLKKFPAELSQLEKLEYLNLNGNCTKTLELDISRLKFLQECCLSGLGLSVLPMHIAKSKNLVYLNLSSNKLKDLPFDAPCFLKLTALFLSKNCLSSLPSWLCSLRNLVVLELQNNRLQGLPEAFYQLTSLRQLDLSFNLFTSIPISIYHSDNKLSYLCLDANPLAFLPEEISNLSYLTHFSVSYCAQLQTFPSGIGKCTNLRMVRASHCSLISLPKSMANLSSLRYLDLSHNHFDCFPIVVCFIPRLRVLLYDQHEGKPLVPVADPSGWFERSALLYPDETQEKKLTETDSHHTHGLQGTISLDQALNDAHFNYLKLPFLIGKLSQLIHLSLQGNGLFVLPDVFHLMNIRRLNLSHNRICFLPPRFHKSQKLTHLYLSNNRIERLDENFRSLTSLQVLTIANNPLVCPPVDLCVGRKVFPVHLYLQRQKLFETALLRSMCEIVIYQLPEENTTAFYNKIGFPDSAITMLEQELPGSYNHYKRLSLALGAWTGLTFELESPTKTQTVTGTSGVPTGTEVVEAPVDGPQAQKEAPLQNPVMDTKSSFEDTGEPKGISHQESKSVYSLTWASNQADLSALLRTRVIGPEACPNRLLQIVHLLRVRQLHDALTLEMKKAQQPKF